ncbi:MAG: hypothetical protein AAF215_03385 [Cyanobacteria bacterium P01_A01_bin.123]
MLDALSLAAATAIAKIVLDKFYEGAGKKLEETATKLGEAAVTKFNEKVQQLGNLIWQRCFRGKPGVDQRLEAAAKGSSNDIAILRDYLDKELEQNDDFTQQTEQLAGEIHQVIVNIDEVKAKNVQQIFSGGQGVLIDKQEQPVIQIQGNPTINFGNSSTDQG